MRFGLVFIQSNVLAKSAERGQMFSRAFYFRRPFESSACVPLAPAAQTMQAGRMHYLNARLRAFTNHQSRSSLYHRGPGRDSGVGRARGLGRGLGVTVGVTVGVDGGVGEGSPVKWQ
jgi:hypothetical protein